MHPFRERSDLRLTNWNLISFCAKCHGKMHNRETDELTPLGERWREKAMPPHLSQFKNDGWGTGGGTFSNRALISEKGGK